jgi:hypothetical protein
MLEQLCRREFTPEEVGPTENGLSMKLSTIMVGKQVCEPTCAVCVLFDVVYQEHERSTPGQCLPALSSHAVVDRGLPRWGPVGDHTSRTGADNAHVARPSERASQPAEQQLRLHRSPGSRGGRPGRR